MRSLHGRAGITVRFPLSHGRGSYELLRTSANHDAIHAIAFHPPPAHCVPSDTLRRMEALQLNAAPLTLSDVESVARHSRAVHLHASAHAGILAARRVVDDHADRAEPVYGLNTGFGSLSRAKIAPDSIRDVQRNLLRSHAAGVGEPLADEVVRAMLLILAASLARGKSGVRLETIETLLALLNCGVTPIVPSRGSVGASGDLAPLAHACLVLIGEGEARYNGHAMSGGEALRQAGIAPITLDAKEGLALINGTHMMAAIGSLALADVERLADAAVLATAMSIDACRATDMFLDERLHIARNQPGQMQVAQRLRALLNGSAIIAAHRENDPRVQDPYCLRASPQVLGAVFDTLVHVRSVFENELGAVTDNPLIFADGGSRAAIVSGGNFHGMPLAIALDTLKIALVHLAGIAERRMFWLLAAVDRENPVPAYLSPQPGLHSGLMIAQYTAAACCNELQTLASPASVGNIPTSAGIEDYNSMGATAAHQARAAIDLAVSVIAIELLVMAEGLDHQRPLRSTPAIERCHERIRSVVPRLTADRPPSPDIQAIRSLILQGALA